MQDFLHKMRQYFGWEGVAVVWDIVPDNRQRSSSFANIPNVVHYFGYNAGSVNQIFTKIHDLDVVDIYTKLKSIYESTRYEPIKWILK